MMSSLDARRDAVDGDDETSEVDQLRVHNQIESSLTSSSSDSSGLSR